MAMLIRGMDITLFEKHRTGTDPFGAPIYEEMPVVVKNVLIEPVGSTDVVTDIQLYGKRGEYRLFIPKGDTHRWEDCRVDFLGHSFRVFGFPTEYPETMLPLDWNKKVSVESYG